jgi:hypothetical protein
VRLPSDSTAYYFVDEAGDPVFFNKRGECIVGRPGCSKVLVLGFISVPRPVEIRKALAELRGGVLKDPYLMGIPSIEKTARAFHAKDDVPEIRERVFRLLSGLDFSSELVVARKILPLFRKRHDSNEGHFYDDIVSKLFEHRLHLSQRNVVYFAKRGSTARQQPLERAIARSVAMFEARWKTKLETATRVLVQRPMEEPCLQVTDYVNRAVYRAYTKKEMRFFNVIRDRVRLLCDVYDTDRYPHNFYSQRNPFDLTKVSPL